ncbi:hypothetical protein DCE93_01175 [Agromyces badenianii]|uniref:Uncharacterized protein n=1 Tax=Agromyces badenianii TaxID=2080742 RepID=A0A2S0WSY3_9MICO|nr:hypothetical protein [Agromyces badenianii]AWB94453.1 hypothetical protein DCE93_01175 [Agromyces badenianii]
MSDGATTGIDPRFDPRFQRGYSGHGVSETDAAPARSVASPPTPAQVPALHRVPDPPMPAPVTQETAEEVEGSVEQLVRVFEPVEPEPEPDPAAGVLRPWLIVAWSLLGAFVVIGLSMIWTVSSDPSNYTGMGSNTVLREITWMSAPALVRVGFLGAVALLSALALRRVWSVRESAQVRPLSGGRAFLGLVGVIAAAIVLVAWYVSITGDGRNGGWSGAPDDEEVRLMALQSTAHTLSSAAVEAALWAVLGLLVLAAISAARARSARPDRP